MASPFAVRETFQSWLDSRGPQGVHSACLLYHLCHLCSLARAWIALWLWSGHIATPWRVPCPCPHLLCSEVPLSTTPEGIGQYTTRKRRYQATQFKETEDSRCLEKKKPIPLRVEHTRSMGQEKTSWRPFGKVTSFFLPPKLPPARNQRPVFCVFPQLCLVAQPGGWQRSFHPASSFLRTKQIQEK